MKDVYRTAICKYEILSGKDALEECRASATNLYNFIWYCAIGFNRKLARARGDYSLVGKLPKYPKVYGIWSAVKDTDEYRCINERVASYVVREFDSQMRSWFNNLKSNKLMKPPRYSKGVKVTFEIDDKRGRSARHIGFGVYRLTALSSKRDDRHVFIRIYLPPTTSHDRVRFIVITRDGRCVVSYKLRTRDCSGTSVAGIDLGIVNIATVAFDNGESILYSGKEISSEGRYWQAKIAECKPSNWNGRGDTRTAYISDRAKKYYKSWTSRKRLMLHNLTDSIVSECAKRDIGTIVIGDLRSVKIDKDFGEAVNRKIFKWPYRQVSDMVRYKAENVGINVEFISERDTSKTCMVCGFVNKKSARKNRGLITCANCGSVVNADVNGAFNILRKYLPASQQLGVAGGLLALPSPTDSTLGIGKFALRVDPVMVARFDRNNSSIVISETGAKNSPLRGGS